MNSDTRGFLCSGKNAFMLSQNAISICKRGAAARVFHYAIIKCIANGVDVCKFFAAECFLGG